jgi:hypothetical protein
MAVGLIGGQGGSWGVVVATTVVIVVACRDARCHDPAGATIGQSRGQYGETKTRADTVCSCQRGIGAVQCDLLACNLTIIVR